MTVATKEPQKGVKSPKPAEPKEKAEAKPEAKEDSKPGRKAVDRAGISIGTKVRGFTCLYVNRNTDTSVWETPKGKAYRVETLSGFKLLLRTESREEAMKFAEARK